MKPTKFNTYLCIWKSTICFICLELLLSAFFLIVPKKKNKVILYWLNWLKYSVKLTPLKKKKSNISISFLELETVEYRNKGDKSNIVSFKDILQPRFKIFEAFYLFCKAHYYIDVYNTLTFMIAKMFQK